MLTDEQLAAIRKRLDAATPGPWEQPAYPSGTMVYSLRDCNHIADCERCTDTDFIAHAPEDVALLLTEVDRLRDELETHLQSEVLFTDGVLAFIQGMRQRLEQTQGAKKQDCSLCHTTIAKEPCTHVLVTGEQVIMSCKSWHALIARLNTAELENANMRDFIQGRQSDHVE